MMQDEQIQELIDTVKCRIAPSKVHGVGIFSIRDIKKGEKLHCEIEEPKWYIIAYDKLNKLPAPILELILGRQSPVVNGSWFLSPNHHAIMVCFMNHSDTPNYDPITDCATEDIPKGCEILENYRVVPNYKLAHPWLVDMV